MTTAIYCQKDYGPYERTIKRHQVESIHDFVFKIRACFEEYQEAILVKQGDEATGIWIREPDVDYDSECGFFEVDGGYPGAEYNLYRPWHLGFWNYVQFHFGKQHVPEYLNKPSTGQPRLVAYS